MPLRLGFVGVGKWAQRLASAFRACGAEIVAYDRREPLTHKCRCGHMLQQHNGPCHDCDCIEFVGGEAATGFGMWTPWRDQLADRSIDAIIAVAPPEVTTEVALACAAAGKPVMATKPLFDHPATIRAPFYVDFWRLWAQAHRSLQTSALYPYSESGVQIELHGSGPIRDFPGMFDYGPHVIAAVLDTRADATLQNAERLPCSSGELFRARYLGGNGWWTLTFGNGSERPVRNYAGHYELDTRIGSEEKSAVLQRFCQSFLNDISEGFVDTRLLELSRRGMAELRRIREMAKPSG